MGLIKKLFFSSKFDEAKHLMNQGKYHECIKNLYEHVSLLEPSEISVERWWIEAQCQFKLNELNKALASINLILEYPSDNSNIHRFKTLAHDLQVKITKIQSNQLNTIVRYPTSTFMDCVTDKDKSLEINTISYEGRSNTLGCYYIRNTFGAKNQTKQVTIYIEPISKTNVNVFVYFSFLQELCRLKADDIIAYPIIIRKLPIIKSLIEKRGKCASSKVSIFNTTDYAQDVTIRHNIPVLGKCCYTDDSSKININDFVSDLDEIFEKVTEILKEIENASFNNDDTIKIASLAFVYGALKTIAGKEVKPVWNYVKTLFK